MKTQTLYDLASEHVNERNTMISVPPPLVFELVQFAVPLRIFHEGQRGSPESSMFLYEIQSFVPICYSYLYFGVGRG